MMRSRLLWFLLMLLPIHSACLQAEPLDKVTFLGLDLFEADKASVRQHLNDLGGFRQERATFSHPNMDKFFPVSQLKDSYYIVFRYDANGQIISVKRLYRRNGLHLVNQYRDIGTQDIARLMLTELGQPQQTQRKGREGGLSYPSYTWQNDQLTIRLDHRGSDPLQPIFIEYILARDPFVKKDEETPHLANRR
ncbi:hypothetical protein [Thiomicrospira microaerophila]|uniref:hypothetical protein n=1 Tax=Thiomicrospira microaerophila TaxID=406020 RepID=UPI00200FD3C5|nr:hypothetical protein [Thiomicrospira microaerophila]